MATTVTLDDDIAARLEQLRRERDVPLDDLINDAIRAGLERLQHPTGEQEPFSTPTANPGRSFIGDIVSVSEAIERAEGPWHR